MYADDVSMSEDAMDSDTEKGLSNASHPMHNCASPRQQSPAPMKELPIGVTHTPSPRRNHHDDDTAKHQAGTVTPENALAVAAVQVQS